MLLPNIPVNDTSIVWATGANQPGFIFLNGPNGYLGGAGGSLTASDYDDSYGVSGASQPGNFSITFSAIISGGQYNLLPVFSVFSPTNNFTNGFIGFLGLDPNGFAETSYDVHGGTVGGTLAQIQIGTATTPLPAALPMFATGLAGLGWLARRRRK